MEVDENTKTPGWMLELENKRKRHHKLAHEVGAGSPCLNCKEDCEGLDLHFWRKVCRNCKCKKEDHDIKEDDTYKHFEILFGDKNDKSKEKIKKTLHGIFINEKNGRLNPLIGNVKQNEHNDGIKFDWVPENVPPNLASEYMQQLPVEKLPITDSEGAIFRRQQLEKQIPLHDFSAERCHDLTTEETNAFEDYVNNVKNIALGQGCITKLQAGSGNDGPKTRPKVLPENKNSIIRPFTKYSEPFKEPPQITELPKSSQFNLRTPSDFVKQTQQHIKPSSIPSPSNETVHQVRSSKANDRIDVLKTPKSISYSSDLGYKPVTNVVKPLDNSKKSFEEQLSTKVNDNANTGEGHDPSVNTEEGDPDLCNYDSNDLSTVSQKLLDSDSERVKSGDSEPPKNQKIRFGPTTVINELSQSMESLPGSFNDYVEAHKEIKCHHCYENVLMGQVAVIASRAGQEEIWHPQCFVCDSCKELLVDLVYFFHEGKVYCGRHYANVLNIPRCFACDELIFLKEYTVAEGNSYHVKHFCCIECDVPLAGMQYIPKDEHPVCLPCYEMKYGKKCNSCLNIIGAGDSRVGWKELSWHANTKCFSCFICVKSLLGGKFMVKNEQLICSKECLTKYSFM